MSEINFKRLLEPFPIKDIEWRIAQSGIIARGASKGKPWAKVLAYITARAAQERLDDVFGVMGWQTEYKINEYREYDKEKDAWITRTGVVCVLSVQGDNGDWIQKSDGAQCTDFEPFKGGISDAFKRVCASGLGIGRYLYNLSEFYAMCQWDKNDGYKYAKVYDKEEKKYIPFWWDVSEDALPEWAIPERKVL